MILISRHCLCICSPLVPYLLVLKILWSHFSYWYCLRLLLPFGYHWINTPPHMSLLELVPYLSLLLLPMQPVLDGLFPLLQLNLIIVLVPHFPNQMVPSSCWVTLFPLHNSLFFNYTSHSLFLWLGLAQSLVCYSLYLELYLCIVNTPYVYLVVFLFGKYIIYSWVLVLILFGMCESSWSSTYVLNIVQASLRNKSSKWLD